MPANPNKPDKPVHGFAVSPERAKVVAAASYDQWMIAEANFSRSLTAPETIPGWFQGIRFRETADGVEVDPTWETVYARIADLNELAKNPDWPEARTFLESAQALAERLFAEQGLN